MKIYPDKIILWNPGELLTGITIDDLKTTHQSVLRNELICNTFYNANLIEAWGRGTTLIIDICRQSGLPEPLFRQNFGGFEVVFNKDIYTEKYLKEIGLNERQMKAVMYVKEKGKIGNKTYSEIHNISRQMATIDLKSLVEKKIFKRVGIGGYGTEYILLID